MNASEEVVRAGDREQFRAAAGRLRSGDASLDLNSIIAKTPFGAWQFKFAKEGEPKKEKVALRLARLVASCRSAAKLGPFGAAKRVGSIWMPTSALEAIVVFGLGGGSGSEFVPLAPSLGAHFDQSYRVRI